MTAELRNEIGHVVIQPCYLTLALKYILTFWAFMAKVINSVYVLFKLAALKVSDSRGGSVWIEAFGQFIGSGVKLRAVIGLI